MYIPKHYLIEDKNEIIDFMKKYSFATIITVKDNFQTASHLPFAIFERNEELILVSHFAKNNNQYKEIEENNVLVIFTEPHAYISPKYYEKELNVPTWNYISIHAYGKGKLITDNEGSYEVLAKMINTYEKSYKNQWDNLPEEYKNNMLKGIVSFEIVVTNLQGKKKLSQNKTEKERESIITSFSKSDDNNEKQISEYMSKNNKSF